MKAGAFSVLLTALLVSVSFTPRYAADALQDGSFSSGSPDRWSEQAGDSSAHERQTNPRTAEFGALLIRNDHALKSAQLAMDKAVDPRIVQYAREQQAREQSKRAQLVSRLSPEQIEQGLAGADALALVKQTTLERKRLAALDGRAFELAYLSGLLRSEPLQAAPDLLFAAR